MATQPLKQAQELKLIEICHALDRLDARIALGVENVDALHTKKSELQEQHMRLLVPAWFD